MTQPNKKSFFAKLRNNFIAGIVVLIPIGITLYLTLFIVKISGKIIPKKIHQIWIGKKIPKEYKKWTKTWMKNNPEYEYFLWDENKILQLNLYNEKQFKKASNPAVKSDIARYEILYRFGGIYVDTDFESLKKINDYFLTYSFVAGQLFGYKPEINNAILFSSKKSKILELFNITSISLE